MNIYILAAGIKPPAGPGSSCRSYDRGTWLRRPRPASAQNRRQSDLNLRPGAWLRPCQTRGIRCLCRICHPSIRPRLPSICLSSTCLRPRPAMTTGLRSVRRINGAGFNTGDNTSHGASQFNVKNMVVNPMPVDDAVMSMWMAAPSRFGNLDQWHSYITMEDAPGFSWANFDLEAARGSGSGPIQH
ncbi:hypothetical protein C8R43DRAFT_1212075 [Mycena crocata]|nr:hypothetical protein C8R43DRAFT_1212075 [Mycena crocata]